jgi:hypothetical protein
MINASDPVLGETPESVNRLRVDFVSAIRNYINLFSMIDALVRMALALKTVITSPFIRENRGHWKDTFFGDAVKIGACSVVKG